MQYTRLGRGGASVSRLCLGTMNFGWHTDERTSGALMDAALEAGINFFDTADIYGAGTSESIIGRWFAAGAGRRDKVVLATKLYIPFDDQPNAGGLSALHIRQACEDSLRRLGTDHIDLYQFHHVDRGVRWEEIWEATDRLVRDGKVLYVGSSNFAGWDIAQAQEKAAARGMFGLVTEQSVYNLLERTVELEVVPAAQHYGMGLLPWSPLGGGLLAAGSHEGGRRGRWVGPARPRRQGSSHRDAAPVDPGLRGAGGGARDHTGQPGAGVAAGPAGRDGTGSRPADPGALHQRPRLSGRHAGRRGTGTPRRAVPRSGRTCPGRLHLVSAWGERMSR